MLCRVQETGFKSKKKAKRSFTLDYERFSVDGHWLHISKLDDPINMAERRVKVGRFFASSKTCSECGYVNQVLVLSDRQWVCQGCGALNERDWNALRTSKQKAYG